MTLREGNIFSRVCLSVISVDKGSHAVITHDALKITIQRPLPPATALPSPVQGEGARTVGKRAIGIQLECFLVVLSKHLIDFSQLQYYFQNVKYQMILLYKSTTLNISGLEIKQRIPDTFFSVQVFLWKDNNNPMISWSWICIMSFLNSIKMHFITIFKIIWLSLGKLVLWRKCLFLQWKKYYQYSNNILFSISIKLPDLMQKKVSQVDTCVAARSSLNIVLFLRKPNRLHFFRDANVIWFIGSNCLRWQRKGK